MITTYYWGTKLEKVRVGNVTFPISVDKAIFDSGASLNYIPNPEFLELIRIIAKDQYCWEAEPGNYVCSCPNGEADTKKFPTIEIDLGKTVL